MLPYFVEAFGNAESSQHAYGWRAKSAIDLARKQTAALIGAHPSEIIFTSGATESIHLAILGLLQAQNQKRHIVTSNAEHKATLEVCERARHMGHEVTILPVDRFGRVSPEQVKNALTSETILVSLLHGNNEIGSLHPIAEIGTVLTEREIIFHVDAAQTAGKIPIDVRAMGIGLLSLSAHKLYGPKGIGALFVRRSKPSAQLVPYLTGGGQERGLRGGTHNVPGIVGLGMACELCHNEISHEANRLTQLRDKIIRFAIDDLGGVELNGHPQERLPHNINLTISGVRPDSLLVAMSDIAYSSGSACSSGSVSHVLRAIGQRASDPNSTTVRFGLGRFTSEAQVSRLIHRLGEEVRKARAVSNGYASL
jgi:cysteine desulfurase